MSSVPSVLHMQVIINYNKLLLLVVDYISMVRVILLSYGECKHDLKQMHVERKQRLGDLLQRIAICPH